MGTLPHQTQTLSQGLGLAGKIALKFLLPLLMFQFSQPYVERFALNGSALFWGWQTLSLHQTFMAQLSIGGWNLSPQALVQKLPPVPRTHPASDSDSQWPSGIGRDLGLLRPWLCLTSVR